MTRVAYGRRDRMGTDEERYGLPMPYIEDSHWGGLPEWNKYHKRQRWQQAQDPDYVKKWQRPRPETAEAVWTIIAKHGLHIEALLPPNYKRIAEYDLGFRSGPTCPGTGLHRANAPQPPD